MTSGARKWATAFPQIHQLTIPLNPMAAVSGAQISTYVYKSVDDLELTLDVFHPPKLSVETSGTGPRTALIHYHRGFLVSSAPKEPMV